MPVVLYCGTCGKRLVADESDAGKVARCGGCRAKVPIPTSGLDKPQIRLFCEGCGSKMKASLNQAEDEMQCPKCSRLVVLPALEQEREEAEPAPKGRKSAGAPPLVKPRNLEEVKKLAEATKGDTRVMEVAVMGEAAAASPRRPAADVEKQVIPSPAAAEKGRKDEEPPPSADMADAVKKIDFDAWQEDIADSEREALTPSAAHVGIIVGVVAVLLAIVGLLLYFLFFRG